MSLTSDELAALVAALVDDRCEWGCAVTYTEATVRHDLAPVVEKIVAARVRAIEDAVTEVGSNIGHYRAAQSHIGALTGRHRAGTFGAILSDLREAVNADYRAAVSEVV